MKIAFFDSGISGLTVLKEALRQFPNEEYIYFADSDHAPYGSRPPSEVEALIADAADFLARKNIDALVLACHTASRLMRKKLQAKYNFPVIGMATGLDEFHYQNTVKKVLVTGTDLSIKAWVQYFQKRGIKADYLSLQKLIVFAENREFHSSRVFDFLYQKLATIDCNSYQAILLGCTHFPFFTTQIQTLLPSPIKVLDGSYATVQKLSKHILISNQSSFANIDYFVSRKPMPVRNIFEYIDIKPIFSDGMIELMSLKIPVYS